MAINKELRCALIRAGIQQADLARHLGRSEVYITDRMNGRGPWSLEEVYKTIDFINKAAPKDEMPVITPQQIPFYFPPLAKLNGGEGMQRKRRGIA